MTASNNANRRLSAVRDVRNLNSELKCVRCRLHIQVPQGQSGTCSDGGLAVLMRRRKDSTAIMWMRAAPGDLQPRTMLDFHIVNICCCEILPSLLTINGVCTCVCARSRGVRGG